MSPLKIILIDYAVIGAVAGIIFGMGSTNIRIVLFGWRINRGKRLIWGFVTALLWPLVLVKSFIAVLRGNA